MDPTQPGTTTALCLPPEVLQLILRHLTQYERFYSCSLVSQQFRQAAAAVTDSLFVQRKQWYLGSPITVAHPYLQQHGHFLTRLEVQGWGQPLHWPPCSNLRHLDLSDGVLWLSPAAQAGLTQLHHCSGLTHLGLTDVRFLACAAEVDVFRAHMTGLQELLVQCSPESSTWLNPLHPGSDAQPVLVSSDPVPSESFSGLPAGAMPLPDILQPLTQLTRLELERDDVTDSSLQHLSALTNLRVLNIESSAVTAAALAAVGSRLQRLTELHLQAPNLALDPSTAEFFGSLTWLQWLWLDCDASGGGDVSVLAGLTQLTGFCLSDTGAQWDKPQRPWQPLQQLLSTLRQLCVLDLDWATQEWPLPSEDDSPADGISYGDFIANSQLRCLALNVGAPQLPQGVWQHVFPSHRLLPHVTRLELLDMFVNWDDDTIPTASGGLIPSCTAELEALVSCCPGLCHLEMTLGDCSGMRLTALASLSGLSYMELGLDWNASKSLLCVMLDIASLTQLVDLSVHAIALQDGAPPGLADLAALTNLTHLVYWLTAGVLQPPSDADTESDSTSWDSQSLDDWQEHPGLHIGLEQQEPVMLGAAWPSAGTEAAPNVCTQLMQWCGGDWAMDLLLDMAQERAVQVLETDHETLPPLLPLSQFLSSGKDGRGPGPGVRAAPVTA